jgi:hypothetical protein
MYRTFVNDVPNASGLAAAIGTAFAAGLWMVNDVPSAAPRPRPVM